MSGTGWTVTFRGCRAVENDCDGAEFDVTPLDGAPIGVEVRTTAQIEHILARELGKRELEPRDREALLSVGGRQLVEKSLAEAGAVEPLLLLDSRLFRVPGWERRLLRECGPLRG